jgi:myo-inositol-1(or 4)-monophosphatase
VSGGSGDLHRARQVAVEAAEAAGRLLRERIDGTLRIHAKGVGGDVVTDLDVAAETLIVQRIRRAFPSHRIIAEESGTLAGADDRWSWLVDPLDGTNNVVIGLPAYVVGVGLCARRSPVLGVVHDPVSGRTWWAERGGGVHGCPPAAARSRPAGGPPVLAWTQGHHVARHDLAARVLRIGLEATSQRLLQLWAPLLAWVMLARGDIDGIVGYEAEELDLAPGAVIALEAGMVIRRLDGGRFDERIGGPPEARSFVAGPPAMVARLVELVASTARAESAADGLRAIDAALRW